MADYVYAVLYDTNKRFFIAHKNRLGYYFANANGNGGTIYPNGSPLNGGGDWALPGGGLRAHETVQVGAAREFLEETGAAIPAQAVFAQMPQQQSGNNTYSAGYFRTDAMTFNNIAAAIINVNLPDGDSAALDIHQGTIVNYGQIHANYPAAPADNELAQGYVWDINNAQVWALIQRWKNDRTKGWFYKILKYFRYQV